MKYMVDLTDSQVAMIKKMAKDKGTSDMQALADILDSKMQELYSVSTTSPVKNAFAHLKGE